MTDHQQYLGENFMRCIRLTIIFSVLLTFLLALSSCVDKDQGREQLASLKIACLGDSITHGFKLSDPGHESYPARLRQLAHGSWDVLDFGVNGATVLNKGDIPITAQKAYQRAIRSEPDVVVVILGTNDTKNINWQYIDEFVGDYTSLIKKLQGLPSKPHVIACTVPPVFSDYPNGINEQHEEKVNILVKKAISMTKADLLDIYTPLLPKPALFIDGIHPNAQGAQEIASLVFNKISSL
jgi:sialate O-acetylesterase